MNCERIFALDCFPDVSDLYADNICEYLEHVTARLVESTDPNATYGSVWETGLKYALANMDHIALVDILLNCDRGDGNIEEVVRSLSSKHLAAHANHLLPKLSPSNGWHQMYRVCKQMDVCTVNVCMYVKNFDMMHVLFCFLMGMYVEDFLGISQKKILKFISNINIDVMDVLWTLVGYSGAITIVEWLSNAVETKRDQLSKSYEKAYVTACTFASRGFAKNLKDTMERLDGSYFSKNDDELALFFMARRYASNGLSKQQILNLLGDMNIIVKSIGQSEDTKFSSNKIVFNTSFEILQYWANELFACTSPRGYDWICERFRLPHVCYSKEDMIDACFDRNAHKLYTVVCMNTVEPSSYLTNENVQWPSTYLEETLRWANRAIYNRF